MDNKLAVVILAAGMGTRMKSNLAKVLHKIEGIPMIQHVVGAASRAAGENIVVVVGHQSDDVRHAVNQRAAARFAHQDQQLGTGHAVMCALPAIPDQANDIVILCGDVPLIRSETITALVKDHRDAGRDATVLAVDVPDPTGYGRIVFNRRGQFTEIVEEADATKVQKSISIINSGIYCANRDFLVQMLPRLQADNVQKELYLTDIISIGYAAKKSIGVMMADDYLEISGINSAEELSIVEGLMTQRRMIIS